MKTHHMVYTKDTGMLKMVPDTGDIIATALLSQSFRVHRREFPVLPPGEGNIRRSAARSIRSEYLAFMPDVIAIRMDSQRKPLTPLLMSSGSQQSRDISAPTEKLCAHSAPPPSPRAAWGTGIPAGASSYPEGDRRSMMNEAEGSEKRGLLVCWRNLRPQV